MGLDFFQKWKEGRKSTSNTKRSSYDSEDGWKAKVLSLFHVGPLELGLLIGATLLIYSFTVRSAPFDFYPTTCVGTWENSTNAAGEPNVAGEGVESFTLENSAIFSGGSQQIVCSDFAGSPVDENLVITRATLALSVAVREVSSETAPTAASETTEEATPDLEIITVEEDSSNEAVVDEPVEETVVTEDTPAESSASDTSSSDEPATNDAPASDTSAPASDAAPSGDTSTSGDAGAWGFVNVAKAQDAETPIEEVTEVTEQEPVLVTEELARAYYSFDGVVWHLLGAITAENVNELTFELPVIQPIEGEDPNPAAITSWADISKVQVKVEASVFTLGQQKQVYLDGMTLTARYQEDEELVIEEVPAEEEQLATEENASTSEELATEPVEEESLVEQVIEVFVNTNVLQKKFRLAGNVLPADPNLPWYPYELKKELENDGSPEALVRRLLARETPEGDLEVEGRCNEDFYTILIYPTADAYAKAPSTALYNSASKCSGAFSVSIASINFIGGPGTYYLVVADQPKDGPWVPISGIIPFVLE